MVGISGNSHFFFYIEINLVKSLHKWGEGGQHADQNHYSTSHGSHCKLVKNSSQLFTKSLECKDCLYSLIDCLHRCELKVKGRIDFGYSQAIK